MFRRLSEKKLTRFKIEVCEVLKYEVLPLNIDRELYFSQKQIIEKQGSQQKKIVNRSFPWESKFTRIKLPQIEVWQEN